MTDQSAADTLKETDRFVDAAYKTLRTYLQRARDSEPAARLGEDPEALHVMRTSIRRLRAALRTFKHALPKRRRDWMKKHLKWLGKELGEVRDYDVYMAYLEDATKDFEPPFSTGVGAYKQMLITERNRAQKAMVESLDDERYIAFTAGLQTFLDKGPPKESAARRANEPAMEPGRDMILKRLKQVLKDGRSLGKKSSSKDLHSVRKRCKRLRYSTEFYSDLLGQVGEDFEARVEAVQDALGAHQDAVVGREILRSHIETMRPPMGKARATDLAMGYLLARHEQRLLDTRAAFFTVWEQFDRKEVHAPLKQKMDELTGRATGEGEEDHDGDDDA